MENLLVSACLLGMNVKYNGLNNYNPKIIELMKYYNLIPICPEVFGGLSIPRIPSEIKDEKVINKEGKDVTSNFLNGALISLNKAKELNISKALLKENSPSCGKHTYDGTFTSHLINRPGITTKLFLENDILVFSENEIDTLINLKLNENDTH